ncbi:hypothetical protein MNB_SUP05-10-331 [hydrothermal vent metagenome]|uniref:Uncharacterized protein n=1 Tax=hydrothermal vent metagenome TaxID=652676 RepID=A0A1W1D6U9_9ZZZZ
MSEKYQCPEAGRDKLEISPCSQQVGMLFSMVLLHSDKKSETV